jgi:fatty-acyl-CoA synthase
LCQNVLHACAFQRGSVEYLLLLRSFATADLHGVVAAVGGAPVPQPLVETWTAHGAAVMTVYGITEAGATVLAVPPARALDKNGTVGLPLLHARCRVRTADGADVAPGEIGELQISGPLVTPGYWERPDATAQAVGADGWLRTGDAAYLDPDGYIVLVDRWKDMYISGGENVYPAEVENVLAGHGQVSQVAVIGVPDERWGESGIAYVVPNGAAAPDAEALREWCAERIARYKVPARVEVVAELPRNATGKVLKTRLRELAARS